MFAIAPVEAVVQLAIGTTTSGALAMTACAMASVGRPGVADPGTGRTPYGDQVALYP
ncbi:MAG TPA: hypothetical protein VMV41_05870 [Cellulomonadaceae bacterium]|nr:hypothetical protein [Cellulomonadaceae bacterium]